LISLVVRPSLTSFVLVIDADFGTYSYKTSTTKKDTKLPIPIKAQSEISKYFENCAITNIRIIGDILLEVSRTTLSPYII
jgi:hypothetical protein